MIRVSELKALAREELRELQQRVQQEIEDRLSGKKPPPIKRGKEERSEVVQAAVQEERFPVLYLHPSNRALTWDGQGPQPEWVQFWLKTGGTLNGLAVAAEKLLPKNRTV